VSRHPRGTAGTVTPIFSHVVFPSFFLMVRFQRFGSATGSFLFFVAVCFFPFASVFLTRGSFLVFLVCFFRFFFSRGSLVFLSFASF
jgi:hypothetical protein